MCCGAPRRSRSVRRSPRRRPRRTPRRRLRPRSLGVWLRNRTSTRSPRTPCDDSCLGARKTSRRSRRPSTSPSTSFGAGAKRRLASPRRCSTGYCASEDSWRWLDVTRFRTWVWRSSLPRPGTRTSPTCRESHCGLPAGRRVRCFARWSTTAAPYMITPPRTRRCCDRLRYGDRSRRCSEASRTRSGWPRRMADSFKNCRALARTVEAMPPRPLASGR
jgi:hypothetical protein